MRQNYSPIAIYTGNNATDAYGFDFKIEALSQLILVVLDDTPEEIHRVRGDALNAFFDSIEFDAEEGGGSVTLAANLATGYKLFIIQANDAPTQPSRWREKFSFTLKGFEMALDFVAGAVQRNSWLAKRSIRLNDAYEGTTFDMQLPLVPEADATLVFSSTGLGFANGPTEAELVQAGVDASDAEDAAAAAAVSEANAAASETAAAASAAAAATSATAAQTAETNAETAETNAETAETNAEAAAAAAQAIVDAFTGGFTEDSFTVTENTNDDLAGVLFDHTVHHGVDFIALIRRGTTVFARQEFSITYRNGGWKFALGPGRRDDASAAHGVTFSVAGSTGQVNAAVNNSGAGDAEIDLKMLRWPGT